MNQKMNAPRNTNENKDLIQNFPVVKSINRVSSIHLHCVQNIMFFDKFGASNWNSSPTAPPATFLTVWHFSWHALRCGGKRKSGKV